MGTLNETTRAPGSAASAFFTTSSNEIRGEPGRGSTRGGRGGGVLPVSFRTSGSNVVGKLIVTSVKLTISRKSDEYRPAMPCRSKLNRRKDGWARNQTIRRGHHSHNPVSAMRK